MCVRILERRWQGNNEPARDIVFEGKTSTLLN